MTLLSCVQINSHPFEDRVSECCEALGQCDLKCRRIRPPGKVEIPSSSHDHSDTSMENPKLYILVEEANGLYFVDGDQPRASVAIECGVEEV